MAKRKLNELHQTHGKVETYTPSTLNQIWGDTGIDKYNTFNLEEYKQDLSEMAKADLRSHAVKMGIIPIDDREQLERRLIKEFNIHTASFRRPVINKPTAKPTKEVFKILSEGR